MTKYYDDVIYDNTDWGGDASTDYLPVSGERVQEYIKGKLSALEKGNTSATTAIKEEVVNRDNAIREALLQESARRGEDIAQEVADRNAAISAAVAAEATSRDEAIVAASKQIATDRDKAITTAIEKEATARDSADVELADKLQAETDTRKSDIDAEIDARKQADAQLSSKLQELEAKDVYLSESAYDALADKDPDKTYYIYEDE